MLFSAGDKCMKASWTYHPRALTKVLFWYSHQNRPICCMTSKKTYENRTVQYAISVELHPWNQRKGIECKLVLLTNRTLLCEHHHVGFQMTPNADCCDNVTRQRESILSKCLDFLLGICKIIIAMVSVRFCLVQVMLCTTAQSCRKLSG